MRVPVNAGHARPLTAVALLILLLSVLCVPRPAGADLRVTVSIAPLHSLAAQVMDAARAGFNAALHTNSAIGAAIVAGTRA